jgi:hypothetical protein
MRRVIAGASIVCVCVAALLVPHVVEAQQRASIVGVVQDSSGAVLPGVTVEASNPALIEQARTAVTDEAGRYAIVDLRPGTYAVTFTLTGFRSVRREGIELAGAFAATVNASLAIGSLEETITVSGASPVVDLQSTQSQTVLNRAALDVLPAARSMQGGASLVPGVSFYSQGFTSNMTYRGSDRRDQHIYFDGMNIGQNLTQQGQQQNGTGVNELAQEELVYDAGSQSAENAVGGVRMDSIPREGGNRYSGVARAFGSTGALESDNVTPELRPFIQQGNQLDYAYEANVVFGGPIRQDKLWFLLAQRVSQSNTLVALPAGYFPNYPNGGQAESGGQVAPHWTVRLTSQLSQRNKLVVAFYKSSGGTKRFDVGCSATSFNSVSCISPEASYWLPTPLNWASQAKWTSPVTNRLLLEVGQSVAVATYKFKYQPEVGPMDIQHFNRTTSVRTVASATAPNDYFSQVWNTVANLSYVTGSHNLKVGVNHQWGWEHSGVARNGDTSVLSYINVGGVPTPSTATLTNSPYDRLSDLNAILGVFASDKWTLSRLTLSYGGRYDYFNASAPEQSAGAGRFMSPEARAARANIAPVSCTPCWHDWSIRFGASYDLFGNGKTALKTSIGKFIAQEALGFAANVNPNSGQSDTRQWTDRDNNGTIFDAAGNVQFNELGATRNNRFGLPGVGATQMAPGIPRGNNWEETVSVQHELFPNVSITGGFYRRHFQNQYFTTNTLVNPDTDYTTYTITVPQNANLPNSGGQVITMYNLIPTKLGAVNSVRTWSENNTRVYNGYEVSINARLPGGGFLFGGATFERTATDECTDLSNSNPNNRRFCSQVPGFRGLYKASAAYTLPYDVQVSGSFQARPGISIGSFYVFNSAIAGVALTGGGDVTVTIVDPTDRYYDYVTTNDMRVARTFRYGRTRIQPFVEIFNVINLSTITTRNENISSNYFQPSSIIQGRRFQLGGRIDF